MLVSFRKEAPYLYCTTIYSMTIRQKVFLGAQAYDFLQQEGGPIKSADINELLKKEKRKKLQEAVAKANQEEAALLAVLQFFLAN